jgi:hypothetical protein
MGSGVARAGMLAIVWAFVLCAACQPGSPQENPATPIRCSDTPVPQARPGVRAIAFPRGKGPVYVGLGSPGVVHYTEDNREHGGWYYHKSLWAISPDYDGPVTVIGHQANGANSLRFNAAEEFPGEKRTSLRFTAARGASEWRYGPSYILIRAPGCYAFDIVGEGLRQRITFRARP